MTDGQGSVAASRELWGVKWTSDCRLDGRRSHLVNENCVPVLFRTRADARAWVAGKYGYIAGRPDLRAEPHGWRIPQAVRVLVSVIEAGAK